MSQQKSRLAASHQLQVLFRDFDDEEAWIKEKEPVASLPNKGIYEMAYLVYALLCVYGRQRLDKCSEPSKEAQQPNGE